MLEEQKGFRRIELSPAQLEEAYEKAIKLEQTKFRRINESDFADIYGLTRVNELKAKLKKRENSMSMEATKEIKRGIVFEILLLDLLQNFWYKDLKFVRSSKYDDYTNGVDALLTKEDSSFPTAIALSMDATNSFQQLSKKGSLIKKHDGLTTVDFFQIGNFRGHLEGVPHVALYMNDEVFVQLIRLWLSENKNAGSKKTLEYHTAQLVFLEQIIYQLQVNIRSLQGKKGLMPVHANSLTVMHKYLNMIKASVVKKTQEIRSFLKTQNYSSFEIEEEIKAVYMHPSLVAVKSVFG